MFASSPSWKPPLFKIGNLPIYVTGLVVLLQIVGSLIGTFQPNLAPLGFFSTNPATPFISALTYPFVKSLDIFVAISFFFFYVFGIRVENAIGRRNYVHLLIALWLLCPAITFLLGLISIPGAIIGAAIPHLAVFVAAISLFPNAPMMFFGFPIKWLAVVFVAITAVQLIAAGNWASLAALAASLPLTLWWMKKAGAARPWGVTNDLFGQAGHEQTPKETKPSMVQRMKQNQQAKAEQKAVEKQASKRETIDAILDKVNEQGLQSLTDKERKLLEAASK